MSVEQRGKKKKNIRVELKDKAGRAHGAETKPLGVLGNLTKPQQQRQQEVPVCTGSRNNRFIEQNNSWHVRYKMFLVRFFAVFYKTTNSVLSGNVNYDG